MSAVQRSLARAAPSMFASLRPRPQQLRQLRFAQPQQRLLNLQATQRMMKAPEDEHKAHTPFQRFAQLKKIPIELYPLGVVLLIAIFAAVYSIINKMRTDVTLRLWRKGKQEDH